MSLRAPMAARRGTPRRCAGLRDWHQCHRRCAEEVPRQPGKAWQDHAEVRLGTCLPQILQGTSVPRQRARAGKRPLSSPAAARRRR